MADLRLCLIGAGRWGRRYIETINAEAGFVLARLASRNAASSALVPASCAVAADWRRAVTESGIDAVIVATPPDLHCEMALACLEARLPVLIEKPLTLAPSQAAELESRARQLGVLAMVSNIHLQGAAYQAMKEHLPAIGTITALRSRAGNWGPFRPDTPPLWDWAPHDLSMCLDLLGTPQSVAATCLAQETIDCGHGGNYRLRLGFAHGVHAEIEIGNMMAQKCRRLEITGSQGRMVLDDLGGTLTMDQDGTITPIGFDPARPLARQLQAFGHAVRAGRSEDSSLSAGRRIVDIIQDCEYQSRY